MPVRAMLRRGSSCQVGFVELRCPLCPSDISPASGGKPGILQRFINASTRAISDCNNPGVGFIPFRHRLRTM